jgi:heme/copper-type cytochrome/quinol oxidase subunit 3
MEKSKLGVCLLLASEANFFLLLILAYVYYHGVSGPGPTAVKSLEPGRAAVNTVFLLASSATILGAERSLGGRRSRLCAWLSTTIALGALFLVGQGREYARLITRDVTISRDLFGSTFFTLTGLHGLHVFAGLVALAILLGLALAGDFDDKRPAAVGAVALYWHFVDAVWIVIFCVVYLGVVR